jgi:hypothetical protein
LAAFAHSWEPVWLLAADLLTANLPLSSLTLLSFYNNITPSVIKINKNGS